MPAEPLWAFLRFSPFRLFSGLLRTLSEHLICRLCAICLTVFLFLRICLFVWHCPIILPKVNGVKSLFRCSNYTSIKARIFLFPVDFRIVIKIYLYLNSAYVPFLACRKANIFSEVKKMETKRNCYDVFEEKISPENVMQIGELIALKTVQKLVLIKVPRSVYVGLVRDINYKNMPGYTITEGYDLAQSAICFLCEHFGERVLDMCVDPKTGKPITLYRLCSRVVSNEIYKRWLFNRNTRGIDIKKDCYEQNFFKDDLEESFKKCAKIIRKMKLTKGERQTLDCYIAGMRFVEIANTLKIDRSNVWRRRDRIQQKCRKVYEELD